MSASFLWRCFSSLVRGSYSSCINDQFLRPKELPDLLTTTAWIRSVFRRTTSLQLPLTDGARWLTLRGQLVSHTPPEFYRIPPSQHPPNLNLIYRVTYISTPQERDGRWTNRPSTQPLSLTFLHTNLQTVRFRRQSDTPRIFKTRR